MMSESSLLRARRLEATQLQGLQPELPDDPDIQELAETLLEQFKMGTEAVVARHQSLSGATARSRATPLAAPERKNDSDLQAAVESLLDEMNEDQHDRAVARARKSLLDRRALSHNFSAAKKPIAAATSTQPAEVAARVLRTAMATTESVLAKGTISDVAPTKASAFGVAPATKAAVGNQVITDMAIPASATAIGRTYERFRSKLGARRGEPRFIKDHRGRGCKMLQCDNGVVILGPRPEAFALWGTVYRRFEAEGGLSRFPGGPPVSHVQVFDDGGAGAEFYDAYSLYRAKGGKVCLLRGAIRTKMKEANGPRNGWYPTSDEGPTKDHIGRRCFTTDGLYLWHPDYGAHFIPHSLLSLWRSLGGLNSTLGWPIADAHHNPLAVHQQNARLPYWRMKFEGGEILQLSRDVPPTVHYQVTKVVCRLDELRAQRKTDEGAGQKDEPFIGGALIDLDGKAKRVSPISLGKIGNKQTRVLNKDVATWTLVQNPFPRWPAPCMFIAMFGEDDIGRGGHEAMLAAWKEIREKADKALAEGASKLGALVESWTGPALGDLVESLVFKLGGWLLHQFMNWLAKAVGDDLFTPYVLVAEVPNGWVPKGQTIKKAGDVRTQEENPVGKPGIYYADWSFRVE